MKLYSSIKPLKIIQITNENQDTSYFTYDGLNPIMIKSDNQRIEFEYQSNKLIKEKVYREGDNIPWLFRGFEYNSQNKIEKVSYNINVNSTVENWFGEKIDSFRLSAFYSYVYEDNKVTKELHFGNSTTDTISYSIINYDLNENIISKIGYTHFVDDLVKNKVQKYEYGSKHHYYPNINYPVYGKIFSRINNILFEDEIKYILHWDNESGTKVMDSTMTTKNYSISYNEFDYPTIISSDDETLIIEY